MKKLARGFYLAFSLLLLYLPIVYLAYFSFSSGSRMDHFQHFSWVHYRVLLADKKLLAIFLQTVILAILASLIATAIGTCGAIGLARLSGWQKKSLLIGNNVLLVAPDVIIGASFLVGFTALGIGLGFWSVLLSHAAFCVPIVVLMILPRLCDLDPALIDAAQDLGAGNRLIFNQIVLPEITPGILAGLFMALTYSLDDFAVTFFVTGAGFTTLSVEIYSRARQGINLEINALSTLMLVVVLLLAGGYLLLTSRCQVKQPKERS